MELGGLGKLLGQIVVAPDHAAAVALDPDQPAVLPVTDLLGVGSLEHGEQVGRHGTVGALLDFLDEARPGAGFELIDQRCWFAFSHGFLATWTEQ